MTLPPVILGAIFLISFLAVLYCEETGGDYYDYFKLPEGRLGVVVADASDHGVGSALSMTTARAFLLSGIHDFLKPSSLFGKVNRFLVSDGFESGRFMTMFFLEIDPGILYDPVQDAFIELNGEGMALGVIKDYEFREYTRFDWTPNSIILVGTDGIHETCNKAGKMFGLDRLRESIRNCAIESAETIQDSVIKDLRIFQGDALQHDDITLVVIKLL